MTPVKCTACTVVLGWSSRAAPSPMRSSEAAPLQAPFSEPSEWWGFGNGEFGNHQGAEFAAPAGLQRGATDADWAHGQGTEGPNSPRACQLSGNSIFQILRLKQQPRGCARCNFPNGPTSRSRPGHFEATWHSEFVHACSGSWHGYRSASGAHTSCQHAVSYKLLCSRTSWT